MGIEGGGGGGGGMEELGLLRCYFLRYNFLDIENFILVSFEI